MVIETTSVKETVRLGKIIGGLLYPGDVVALVGELGTGKTHLIKGLAEGVGVDRTDYISSPSFTLINEYPGRVPFYHLDVYRLRNEREAEELGLEEYLQGKGVTAIEWADHLPTLLPEELLRISLRYAGERGRLIEITGIGKRYEKMVCQIEIRVRSHAFGVKSRKSSSQS